MSDRRVGDTVGHIPKLMQLRFLNLNIRKGSAWKQLEAIGKESIKLFGEIDREFDLEDWIYGIDNVTGKIELERHKTMQERELVEAQRALIENGEGEAAK